MQNVFKYKDCVFDFETVGSAVSEGALCSRYNGYYVFPGFCDVHVHFRQPGFSYKETIATGSMAAARGGFTCVCTMPNLNPVPDTYTNLQPQLEHISRDAVINIVPYGSITRGQCGTELSDMDSLQGYVVAFSDDGRGVQTESVMRQAMLKAQSLNKVIVAHCEDNSLLNGGYIHDGTYAKKHGHKGISSESEYGHLLRDIKLVEEIGCAYHVCHVSTKESVEAIRQAKKRGLDITCETAPHYLILDDSCLCDDGRFKMNPPLRSNEDRCELIRGVLDGTIDMIATDHAPHSKAEKALGLKSSAFGIVGLETAFQEMYTHFVKTNILSLEALVKLMSVNPRKRFRLSRSCGFTIWDLECQTVVDPNKFFSKGRATPFQGDTVYGKCIATVYNNNLIYHI